MSAAGVIVVSAVLITAVIMSVFRSGETLAALLDLVCTGSTCPAVGLAFTGWAIVGGPFLLAGLIILISTSGATARYAMLACVGLGVVGFTIVYAGIDTLHGTYPDFVPLHVGTTAAVLALILGATISGGPAHHSWERPRYSSSARLPSAAMPLLAVGVCELLALAAVLVWVTAFR
ncbi:hypothetical protein SAMN05443287_101535 [Micromonospora phaseoli]|uniref:Uncharacterized protein n=1 Tax=Micromonospora phaseoli TaxID=1144548 RepID=A0A1H6S2Q0_9ACTN|nr:hypothetical protein [Micromonospora phaseoli]PZW03784.1 hypothetical protein CLV64_101535 [Micromonospora phaseoli]GIJ79081.1 hypothetical protein Xph01_35130 [Micromonospora phaseoli]SEI62428.1 hypothetical protein SAMN05443287_101535 [Micromonospora phaseoli]